MTRPQFPRDPADRELLRAVLEAPADDAPRLVYADRLIERGDPRGELVIVECALARIEREGGSVDEYASLHRRARQLHRTWDWTWFALGGERWKGEIGRGFFTKITCSLETLRYRWRLFSAHPLERIGLTVERYEDRATGPLLGAYRWLIRKPTVQRTSTLDVAIGNHRFWFDTEAFVEALADVDPAAPDPTRVYGTPRVHRRLEPALRCVCVEHATVEELRQLTYDPPPLLGVGCSGGHVEALTELLRPRWPGLRSFDVRVHGQPIDDAVIRMLAEHPMFETLERLRIGGDVGLVTALGRVHAPKLRSLTLSWANDETLRAFAESDLARRLERLSLETPLAQSATPLASLPLRHLDIRGVAAIDLATAKVLASSPTLYTLKYMSRLAPGVYELLTGRWG